MYFTPSRVLNPFFRAKLCLNTERKQFRLVSVGVQSKSCDIPGARVAQLQSNIVLGPPLDSLHDHTSQAGTALVLQNIRKCLRDH